MHQRKGYAFLAVVCFFYWIVDSVWSFLSFENNLKNMIFSEPTSLVDTLLLRVPPYQTVSRIMVVFLFIILGILIIEFMKKMRESDKKRKEAHDTFLMVLNSIDATVYVSDMQTYEILFMNQYMIKSFGRDMTGDVCWDVFTGGPGQCPHCPIEQLIDDDGQPTGVYTWQGQNPVTGKWYVNYDRAIEWTDGRMVKIQIATDISEMKHMENQLRQAHKMESIGTLAGGIAHEFNNVLSIIIGNNELVMEDLPEWSLTRESAEEIRIASMRARDVVKQLLTFSRQDNAAKTVLNIRSVVHESMKLIRSSIPANIEIRENLSDDVSPVLGNATQINQVLINLCANAVDAMPGSGGVLTVNLSNDTLDQEKSRRHKTLKAGQYVSMEISDNGVGMDEGVLDKMFEPYYTTKEIGKGTGIGLAVVHGIVEKHGGAISADSNPGQGTKFTIYLPAHESLPEIENDEPIELPAGKERVLYIDDEPSIAKLGKRHLESLGYAAESTTDPLQALEIVTANPDKFDLIISDMAMPEMTGDHLIAEVLKIRPDMPTIICTGYSVTISEKEAAKIGVASFVMKPLDKADLAKIVRKVLDEAKR